MTAPPQPDLATAIELHNAGRVDEAIVCYEAILAAEPNDPATRFRLALALIARKRLDDAAVVLGPVNAQMHDAGAEVYYHLGTGYRRLLRPVQAAEWFRRALLARPAFIEARFYLALALQNQGLLDEAAEQYRLTLKISPEQAEARHNLALVLQMLGRHGEAVELYRNGLGIAPHAAEFARYCVTSSFYDPTYSSATRFALAEQFGQLLDRSGAPRNLAIAADPNRRLRIGYLTSDFRDHPVARNVEPLLIHRNKRDFEVVAYADIQAPDAATQRLQGTVDLWRPIHGMTDGAVADRIQEDRIDILVCLAAHFDRNRPLVCASRPAPVQVSFHDVTTSGSKAFDYLIADRVVCPPRPDERFSERVVRLPGIYVHAPLEDIALREADPAPRPITFGCLNNPAKLNNGILAVWAHLLSAVPDSRLTLKYGRWFEAGDLQQRVAAVFAALGISAERLQFLGGQESRTEHLARYNQIDIALDPYPFGGSTATFEALWMGVPVVTYAGNTMMSRWSASILRSVGLEDLVARTVDAYIAVGRSLAADQRLRRVLRRELRGRVRRSPLCNGPLRARQIERVYRALWRRWCTSAAA